MNPRLFSWVKQAQLVLFAWIVFLIPSNMFFKLSTANAYVSGMLVDYLIPKLYLTDIFIIVLICLWLIELGGHNVFQHLLKHIKLLSSALFFVVLHILSHQGSFIGIMVWTILTLMLMWMFALWIHEKKSPEVKKVLFVALSCAVVFQSIISGYQYLAQRPIFGYWFFGEPMFTLDPTVAKSTHPGALAILPYGTTAHPNILAGVVVLSTLYLMYLAGLENNKKKFAWAGALAVSSAGLAWIAESGTALAALAIGIAAYWSARTIPHSLYWSAKRVMLGICVVLMVAVPLWIGLSHSTMPSIQRRNELERVAINAIVAQPIFGSGLTLFTTVMQRYGTVSGTIRFLQPVHNLPLLWTAETGLLGIACLILILYFVHKSYSMNFLAFAAVGLPLLPIISLDHYLLSVQSGMLIATIILAELFEKKVDLH